MLQKLGFLCLLAIGLVLVFPSGDPDDVARLATGAVPALAAESDDETAANEDSPVKTPKKIAASEEHDDAAFVMGSPVTYSEDDDSSEPNAFESPPVPKYSATKTKGGSGKVKTPIAPKNRRHPPEMV